MLLSRVQIDLEIERGRYGRMSLPIEERQFKLCSMWMIQAVECEPRFLIHCPFYSTCRDKLYEKLTQMHYIINAVNDQRKFTWLLN